MGRNALGGATTATDATALGNGAFLTGNYSNSTAIGAGAQPTANNQVWLGNSYTTVITGALRPKADDTHDVGSATFRYHEYFGGNPAINTSDVRLKTNLRALPDETLDAWGDVPILEYQWIKARELKGDKARLHVSPPAQGIRDAFAARGLDATRYSLLCYDEWDDQLDHDGNVIKPAGNLWSLRGEHCLWVEAARTRRELDRLRARLDKLESRDVKKAA
jgi:hypothetical protein